MIVAFLLPLLLLLAAPAHAVSADGAIYAGKADRVLVDADEARQARLERSLVDAGAVPQTGQAIDTGAQGQLALLQKHGLVHLFQHEGAE